MSEFSYDADPKPFIKWAGGKTQLLPAIFDAFPKSVGTYYEPFTGGGAVFFALASQTRYTEHSFRQAIINDWNPELVACYTAIKNNPQKLMETLDEYYRQRDLMGGVYAKNLYLDLRAQDPEDLDTVSRAARMIYLNKNCFNGLYRVNKKGQFNVPIGKFKKPPALYSDQTIMSCHRVLEKTRIMNGDFELILDDVMPGDLVYFDPPYVPLNPTSDFTSYTSVGFGLEAQQRLAKCFRRLANIGASVVLSNSDTEIVRELYRDFEVKEVLARRSVNSKGSGRGAINELLVVHRGITLAKTTPHQEPRNVLSEELADFSEYMFGTDS